MLRQKLLVIVLGLFFGVVLLAAGCTNREETARPLRIGTLPIEDTLPFYVAQEKGYFTKEQVAVELVPFQSAVERDSAFQSGEIDGQITDLVAAALLQNAGVDQQIVSITLGVRPEEGRFTILAAPGLGIERLDQLRGTEIAVSQNSIIEYVTDQLLLQQGFLPEEIKKTVIPKIPVRVEMLLNNQIKAATLPDPMAAYAVFKGAKVILDDTEFNISQAVLIFRKEVLESQEDNVSRLMRAYKRAVLEINAAPESYRALFVEKAGVPEPIKDTYQVAHFSPPAIPTREQFDRVINWMLEKGLLQKALSYDHLVNGGFLEHN